MKKKYMAQSVTVKYLRNESSLTLANIFPVESPFKNINDASDNRK